MSRAIPTKTVRPWIAGFAASIRTEPTFLTKIISGPRA